MENTGICASITNKAILSWGKNSQNLSLVACSSFQVEGDSAEYRNINEQTPVKKKSIAEGKLELLTKCAKSFSKSIPQPAESSHQAFHFVLFKEEKLNSFDKRATMITGKKISDLIFDNKMSLDSETEVQNIMLPVNTMSNILWTVRE